MSTETPALTLDQFAKLYALLAPPFADRDAVLRKAGLDETCWQEAEQRWCQLIAENAAGVLSERFWEAVDQAQRGLAEHVERAYESFLQGGPTLVREGRDAPLGAEAEEAPPPTVRSARLAQAPDLAAGEAAPASGPRVTVAAPAWASAA